MSIIDQIDKNTGFLIVDDFPTMRLMIRQSLKRLGFNNCSEAEDGSVALDLLRKNKYGCIISDWNMPKVSGLELLKSVRSVEEQKSLPFIMVTAQSERAMVVEAIQAGASNYIVKPVSVDELGKKIEAVFTKLFKEEAKANQPT